MASYRTIKKAVYAVGFFAVVFGIITWIVFPWLHTNERKQIVANTGSSYVPILLENVVVIPHIAQPGPKGRTIDVVARLKNENPRAGTGTYPVVFTIKDAGGIAISRFTQDAYVLPGGLQYIIALDVAIPFDKTFGKVEVTPPTSIELIPLSDNAKLPDFSVFLRNLTNVMSGTYSLQQQTGIVTNNSTFDWEKVEVVSIALDSKGNIIGVGKTFVGKLLIGEQREFTVQWPLPDSETSRVIAIATTNIYSDANIVHIVGDPGKLR